MGFGAKVKGNSHSLTKQRFQIKISMEILILTAMVRDYRVIYIESRNFRIKRILRIYFM